MAELAEPQVQVQVYPSPTNGKTQFVFDRLPESAYAIWITDVSGKIIHQANTTGVNYHWEASHVAAGLYFYRVAEGQVTIGSGKVIVK